MINVTEIFMGKDGNAGKYYDDLPRANHIVNKRIKTRYKKLFLSPELSRKIDAAIKKQYGSRINFCRRTLFKIENLDNVLDFKVEPSELCIKNLMKLLGLKDE